MNLDPEHQDSNKVHNYERQVRKEILSLFSDDRLKGKFSIPEFTFHQIRIQLLIQKVTVSPM